MIGFLTLTAQAMLATVFAVSLAAKTRGRSAYRDFLDWLRSLAVIPRRFTTGLAAAVVCAEASALVLLVVPATRVLGLALAAAVTSGFALAIGWLNQHDVVVPCRCFGLARRPMGALEIARNAGLALIAATAAVTAVTAGVRQWPEQTVSEVALAWLLGAGLAAVAVRLDDVVVLFKPLSPQ